jgi:hypothetical protein
VGIAERSGADAPPTEVTLRRLAGELRDGTAHPPLLAAALRDEADDPVPEDDPHLGQLAANGPRADGRRDEIALIVEAIREGFLLHYGRSRLLRDDDPDLLLLAGDRLYALGLARLAALGDLEAVGQLAEVISLSAQAHAEGRPELADAAWDAGALAVGWGADGELRAAQEAARKGVPGAEEALRAAARRLAGDGSAVAADAGRRGGGPRRLSER